MLQVIVVLDVALDERGDVEPQRLAVGEQRLEQHARVVAEVAAGASVEDDLGGLVDHAAIVGGCAGRARGSGVVHRIDAMPGPTLYERVGGMPFFGRLVDQFYADVRGDDLIGPMYANDPADPEMAGPRRRLTLFLVQYWGGPTTYLEERGHPRLRARQSSFHIGTGERDVDAFISALAELRERGPRLEYRQDEHTGDFLPVGDARTWPTIAGLPSLHTAGHSAGCGQF